MLSLVGLRLHTPVLGVFHICAELECLQTRARKN